MDGEQIHREIDEYLRQARGAHDESEETLDSDPSSGTPLFGRRGTLVEVAEEIAVEGCGVIPTGEIGKLVRAHSLDPDDFPETVAVQFDSIETPVMVKVEELVEPYPRGPRELLHAAIQSLADAAIYLNELEDDPVIRPLVAVLYTVREQLESDAAQEMAA